MTAFLHNFFLPLPAHSAAYYGKLTFGLLFGFAVLAALQFAPRQARKGMIAFVTFLGGLYYAAEFFLPAHGSPSHNALTPYQDTVANVSAILISFAIGLGVISLLQLHGRIITRRRDGWGNSVALIVSFLAMTTFGLLNEYAPHSRVLGSRVTSAQVYDFLFTGGFSNLRAATFSIIAFYIASACYRAFRIRSAEAALLMAAGLIVMLGSVTIGTAITNGIQPANTDINPWANLRIEHIAEWLLLEVNGAAQRGILFGLTIGLLAIALRLWLSLERGVYFDREV